MAAADRTYLIFPERMPPKVKLLLAEVKKQVEAHRKHSKRKYEELLESKSKLSVDEMKRLVTEHPDEGVRELLAEADATVRKKEDKGLTQALGRHSRLNSPQAVAALQALLDSPHTDPGVRAAANRAMEKVVREQQEAMTTRARPCPQS